MISPNLSPDIQKKFILHGSCEFISQISLNNEVKQRRVDLVHSLPDELVNKNHINVFQLFKKLFKEEKYLWKRSTDTATSLSQLTSADPKTVGEAILRHGKHIQNLYNYFGRLNANQCQVTAADNVAQNKLVLDSNHKEPQRDSLSKEARCCYELLLKCIYEPIQDSLRNVSQNKRRLTGVSLNTNAMKSDELIIFIQKVFNIRNELHKEIENNLCRDSSGNRLEADLLDQMNHLNFNSCPFYKFENFTMLSRQEHEKWKEAEIDNIKKIFKKKFPGCQIIFACSPDLHNIEISPNKTYSLHDAYAFVADLFYRFGREHCKTEIVNNNIKPAADKLLEEFGLRYGVRNNFQQIVLLKFLVKYMTYCDCSLQNLLLQLLQVVNTLKNNEKYLVKKEREYIKEALSQLHEKIAYGFVKLYTFLKWTSSTCKHKFTTTSIDILIELLNYVAELKEHFGCRSDHNSVIIEVSKKYVKVHHLNEYLQKVLEFPMQFMTLSATAAYKSISEKQFVKEFTTENVSLIVSDVVECIKTYQNICYDISKNKKVRLQDESIFHICENLYEMFKQECIIKLMNQEVNDWNEYLKRLGLAYTLKNMDLELRNCFTGRVGDWQKVCDWQKYFFGLAQKLKSTIEVEMCQKVSSFVCKDKFNHIDCFNLNVILSNPSFSTAIKQETCATTSNCVKNIHKEDSNSSSVLISDDDDSYIVSGVIKKEQHSMNGDAVTIDSSYGNSYKDSHMSAEKSANNHQDVKYKQAPSHLSDYQQRILNLLNPNYTNNSAGMSSDNTKSNKNMDTDRNKNLESSQSRFNSSFSDNHDTQERIDYLDDSNSACNDIANDDFDFDVSDSILPLSSSFFDFFLIISRSIDFIYQMKKLFTNTNTAGFGITMLVVEIMLRKFLVWYCSSVVSLDFCGMEKLKGFFENGFIEEDLNILTNLNNVNIFEDVNIGCRHKPSEIPIDFTSCIHLEKILTFNLVEPISKEMCLRLNNVYSVIKLIPFIRQKISTIFPEIKESFLQNCQDTLQDMFRDQINIFTSRVIAVFVVFDQMLKQQIKGATLSALTKDYCSFVQRQSFFLNKFLMMSLCDEILMDWWKYIVKVIFNWLNDLNSPKEDIVSKADELSILTDDLREVFHLYVVNKEMPDIISSSLMYRLRLYKQEISTLLEIDQLIRENSRLDAVENGDALELTTPEIFYLLFKEVRKECSGNNFSGSCLLDVLTRNPDWTSVLFNYLPHSGNFNVKDMAEFCGVFLEKDYLFVVEKCDNCSSRADQSRKSKGKQKPVSSSAPTCSYLFDDKKNNLTEGTKTRCDLDVDTLNTESKSFCQYCIYGCLQNHREYNENVHIPGELYNIIRNDIVRNQTETALREHINNDIKRLFNRKVFLTQKCGEKLSPEVVKYYTNNNILIPVYFNKCNCFS